MPPPRSGLAGSPEAGGRDQPHHHRGGACPRRPQGSLTHRGGGGHGGDHVGAATNAQIAAFLTALRMKGETVEELIGFAQVMRQKAVKVRTRAGEVVGATGTDREMLIDTAGTGGDASRTFQ